jgi:tRNA threonylcarbamoyl adenosine modification protein (Sua5/YciO/YrdC/YwlC family)
MSQYFAIHPSHPQRRLVQQAATIVREGGLVVYPTDTTYALGCHIGDKQSLERIRQLRRLDKDHHFTLTCRDLSEISLYARVDDVNYRILKHFTPGPFTFILPATREVPRRLVHAKRKTIGLRIPDNPIALALLEALNEPMMTTTMRLPDQPLPYTEPEEIRADLQRSVDLIVDGGSGGVLPTTVVNLTGSVPEIQREGMGVFE